MNTVIEILIDSSGSMGDMKAVAPDKGDYKIDGRTRMSIVKEILIDEVLPTIDYAARLFIRTFRINSFKVGEKTLDKIYAPLIYCDIFNKENIEKIIKNLQDPPLGGTPITAAIEFAIKDLEKFTLCDRKIILLTDGEENGGGNYIEAAKRAKAMKGIECKIFIIGLAQNQQEQNKALEIATGGYVNIQAANFSKEGVRKALAPLKKVVLENSIQNIETPISKSAKNIDEARENINSKITSLNIETKSKTNAEIETLENRIKQQIENSHVLLKDLDSIKESLRVQQLLTSGVDSTTLTIDEDYSEEIRRKSELDAYHHLIELYPLERVIWLNQNGESFASHDFEILDDVGNLLYIIECKGTPRNKTTFYLTAEEWKYFLKNKEIYQLIRVHNVAEDTGTIAYFGNMLNAIMNAEIVPYLLKPEILKEERIFLTILK